jgi:hypothetical protein
VIPAVSNWAVQLHNAVTIPNRAAVNADSARGLTLATNGAIYVQGTYNAPTRRVTDPNYALVQGAEAPAALVADAIMLLSDSWDNSKSGKENRSNHRQAVDTVYSTALVMGNVPAPSGDYGGGLENFPRFLENWGSNTDATYRGSLIRLFRSESFAEKWGYSNVYDRPERDWSFHTGFREYSPPLDTGPRSFRRVYFKELTEKEFATRAAELF